ncbi:HTH-type transcriptional regulator MhqR [Rosistilla carotiformis]|uniref:HTH-type transcriptional regulator MhqR n=1 Tax=Rosistilla carotiformis TaxID=2528017 RepID=A0A518JTV8_9BACT|nr:MarR family transcriptional regulator [Rosistilla carotiformis]QDV68984.1 HTH-type transcriptional regulator MhqR [Rosistilla carotiformis]
MKLQEELHRPIPFVSLQQEALLNLLRIGDQLEVRLSRYFREHGLTLSRFNVLRNLILADRPLTCGEIGDRMIQVVPAITSLVDHLENQGLVQRERCDEDRRVVHVRITKAGRKLADTAMKPLNGMETDLFAKLNSTELKSLIGLAEKVRESFVEYDKLPS